MTYTAAVLTTDSRNILIDKYQNWATGNFEIIAHHVTMYMGSIKPKDQHLLGKEVQVRVISIASDNKVIAVGVVPIGFDSDNKNPHITFATDRTAGGKPVMSNKLQEWNPISPFILNAIVEEVH